MITLPARLVEVAGADVHITTLETDQPPPPCERCPEHPAGPGVVAVIWEPISAAGGCEQVCLDCVPAAVTAAFDDSAATALASRAVRVQLELWVAPRPAEHAA